MSKILKHYSLERNPFTDRIAEKSNLSPDAYYLLSDLEGFKPNETTYLFFGKRGSGKTTIRTQVCLKPAPSSCRNHHQVVARQSGCVNAEVNILFAQIRIAFHVHIIY
eukprot:8171609-Pyramimonas_sp.AAC.1